MSVINKPVGAVGVADSVSNFAVSTAGPTFFDTPYSIPATPNLRWGETGPHPTEIEVGRLNGARVYRDQTLAVNTVSANTSTSNFLKVPLGATATEYGKRGLTGDGQGQAFGYATCQWLRKCQGGQYPGQACGATLSGVTYTGYCFASDTGSLECGRLSAIDNEYGEKPVSFDLPGPGPTTPQETGTVPTSSATTVTLASTPGVGPAYRCPTGSPAKSLGSFVSKRPLVAGCMISNDTAYDALAEVHVSDYCAVAWPPYLVGCMMPGALNFDPAAKTPGFCHYQTLGCMDSMAANYNPRATVAGSCIAAVRGCTVANATYEGVAPDTPAYKSGFYGFQSAYRQIPAFSGGIRYESGPLGYNGPAVTNYNSMANWNEGCIVAVEGCMDPTAVNYDPQATVNSYTWCLPPIPGCMYPDVSFGFVNPQPAPYYPMLSPNGGSNGPNLKYSIFITQHVPSSCTRLRYGCMNQTLETGSSLGSQRPINFDDYANSHTVCFSKAVGCLNPVAVNFGCSDSTSRVPCLTPPTGAGGVLVASEVTVAGVVNTHSRFLCKWSNEPAPPTPPPPSLPEGGNFDVVYDVKLRMQMEADLASLSAQQDILIGAFKTRMGYDDTVNVTVVLSATPSRRRSRSMQTTSGVGAELNIPVADAAAASTAQASISESITPSGFSAALASAGVTGVQVLSADAAVEVTLVPAPAPPELTDDSTAGIIGGVVGGVGGFIFVIALAVFFWKRKKSKEATQAVYPA